MSNLCIWKSGIGFNGEDVRVVHVAVMGRENNANEQRTYENIVFDHTLSSSNQVDADIAGKVAALWNAEFGTPYTSADAHVL